MRLCSHMNNVNINTINLSNSTAQKMASDTEDLINGFQALKLSALSKSKLINDQIKDVTIGPNRTILSEDSVIDVPDGTSTPVKKKALPQRKSLSPPENAGNSALKKIISDLEKQRQESVQQRILCRKSAFDEFSRREELGRKEQWLQQQQKMVETMQQQESLILDALEQYDKNVSNQHQQLVQYYHDLAEKQKKDAEELEEREKRNAQINSIIESIKKDQTEFRLTFQDIGGLLKSHAADDTLKSYLPEISNQLSVLPKKMTQIVTCCKAGQITENELKKASETLAQLKTLKQQIEKIVAYSDGLKEEAVKAQQQLEQQQQQQQQLQQQQKEAALQRMQQEQKDKINENVNNAATAVESLPAAGLSVIEKYCSRANLIRVSELQQILGKYRQSYKQFAEDGSLKQYKFDLKKAVNIPINAISAVSAKHLLDKYDRLHNLLAGRSVIVGDAQIAATKHPQAIAFCMDLVAEKLVLQGDLLISSNPEAAFNYAAVIVALWNDFPDFGRLVLAHFYEVCPYLVPLYVPRTADQTTEDYYKSQGYKYTDGVPEKQDKFLKRMTGIMRLYSAIFITKPKRGQNKNPHGINEAWRWIASVLNLEPRLDITATLIHVFLETVGFSMQAVYGKMFQKLMRFIREKYMPMVEKIDSGGPFTRLSVLFDNYAEKQILESPSGILPSGFW